MIFLMYTDKLGGNWISNGHTVQDALQEMKRNTWKPINISDCKVFSTELVKAKVTTVWETELAFHENKS